MSEKNSYMVFSGTATKYLAEKICQSLGCPLGQLQITKFSDGEFAVSYEESIRGRDVFLVQSTFPSSDNLMELLLMIDAAKRASARTINAVIPYFGWARQDRKDKPRVSIGAKLVADLLSVAGVNRVITMDLHADQIQGFFDVPVDHLYASGVILPIRRERLTGTVVKVVLRIKAMLRIVILSQIPHPLGLTDGVILTSHMVGYEVDDHLHASLMRAFHELFKLQHTQIHVRSQIWINIIIIGDGHLLDSMVVTCIPVVTQHGLCWSMRCPS